LKKKRFSGIKTQSHNIKRNLYLSILRLWIFRKYGAGTDNAPGIEVHTHEGVNVLETAFLAESDAKVHII
jgi:hypothetical protein